MSTRREIEAQLRERCATTDAYKEFVAGINYNAYVNPNWKSEAEFLEGNYKILLDKADKFGSWKTVICRALELPTPDEKPFEYAEKANELARESNRIAEESNRKADEANRIAASAAATAGRASLHTWIASIAAIISALAAVVAIFWKTA